jgi:hypothetical protein
MQLQGTIASSLGLDRNLGYKQARVYTLEINKYD